MLGWVYCRETRVGESWCVCVRACVCVCAARTWVCPAQGYCDSVTQAFLHMLVDLRMCGFCGLLSPVSLPLKSLAKRNVFFTGFGCTYTDDNDIGLQDEICQGAWRRQPGQIIYLGNQKVQIPPAPAPYSNSAYCNNQGVLDELHLADTDWLTISRGGAHFAGCVWPESSRTSAQTRAPLWERVSGRAGWHRNVSQFLQATRPLKLQQINIPPRLCQCWAFAHCRCKTQPVIKTKNSSISPFVSDRITRLLLMAPMPPNISDCFLLTQARHFAVKAYAKVGPAIQTVFIGKLPCCVSVTR